MAVIADAVRDQKVIVRMFGSQTLCRAVILDQETFPQPGQVKEFVQPERVFQASGNARVE